MPVDVEMGNRGTHPVVALFYKLSERFPFPTKASRGQYVIKAFGKASNGEVDESVLVRWVTTTWEPSPGTQRKIALILEEVARNPAEYGLEETAAPVFKPKIAKPQAPEPQQAPTDLQKSDKPTPVLPPNYRPAPIIHPGLFHPASQPQQTRRRRLAAIRKAQS